MSIASQIELLAANKSAIKVAIQGKNPSVAPTDVLSQWPTSIESIPLPKQEQTKTASPTVGGTTVYPDTGKVLSSVSILPVTSSIDANIVAVNIKKDVVILGVTGTYEGSGSGEDTGHTLNVDSSGDNSYVRVYKTDGTHQDFIASGSYVVQDAVYFEAHNLGSGGIYITYPDIGSKTINGSEGTRYYVVSDGMTI